MWLILISPTTFFKSYTTGLPPLSQLTFPLAGLWQLASSKPQKVMRPFQSLAVAIGLVAFIAVLENWAWRITGFSERVFGMSPEQMASNWERNLKTFYEQQYGKQLTIIDTSHLSGIAFVDGPAHEIIALLHYMYFPLVVSIFLVNRAIRRSVLMHFYVYAVSASLAVFFVSNIAGLIVFLLLQGVWAEAAVALSQLPVMAGDIARAYFLVILPVLVLPNILPLTRGRVVAATLVGALAWMTANYMLTQLLLFNLGVVDI
jgi:hypothetical protein